MSASSLKMLRLSDGAQITVDTLNADDSRIVQAWFEHLEHWDSDSEVRSRSTKLNGAENLYSLEIGPSIVIVFSVEEDEILVRSIFRKEFVKGFEALAGRATR